MKLVAASLALGFLLGGTGAEAGIFGSRDQLPQAIDTPMVRPRVKESHKVKKARHPAKYEKFSWGAIPFDKNPPRPMSHYQVR